MIELEDLTLIWDTELTEEQWFNIARKEYIANMWEFTKPRCSKKLSDINGSFRGCSRLPGHIGPCTYLRFKVDRTADGTYMFNIVDGLKDPQSIHDRRKHTDSEN